MNPRVSNATIPGREPKAVPAPATPWLLLLVLFLFAYGVYKYSTMRYAVSWNENDTTVLTRAIYHATAEGSALDPDVVYGNGVNYQYLSMFLLNITGISVQALQLYVYPAVSALLVLEIFTIYRTLLAHTGQALFATLLMFVQPDFLFVTWRGSHERITWLLALLMLFLLIKSFTMFSSRPAQMRFTILFYMVVPAFVTSNAFFASSFTAMMMVAFLAGLILLAMRERMFHTWSLEVEIRLQLGRLLYIGITIGVLLYVFMFHIYEPALDLIRAFGSVAEGLRRLFLVTERQTITNPYQYLSTSWLDVRIYVVVAGLSFVIAGISALLWLVGVRRYFKRTALTRADLPRLMLWLIFPAAAAQLVAALGADRVNTYGGNLQVRLFTPMMIFAIPITTSALYSLLRHGRWRRLRIAALVLTAILLMPITIVSLFKVTNEPILSNNWIFATHSELQGTDWVFERSHDPTLWIGIDRRMATALGFWEPEVLRDVRLISSRRMSPRIRYYLISAMEHIHWERLGLPLLYTDTESLIYDNGEVQIVYRRPRSPYQR
jgi:hypothetical protein